MFLGPREIFVWIRYWCQGLSLFVTCALFTLYPYYRSFKIFILNSRRARECCLVRSGASLRIDAEGRVGELGLRPRFCCKQVFILFKKIFVLELVRFTTSLILTKNEQ